MKCMLIALTALGLAACAPTTQQQGGGNVAAASAFNPVEVPREVFASPLAVAESFANYSPSRGEGSTDFDLIARSNPDDTDTYVLQFSVDGYADDSVRGEQWRVVIARAAEGWTVRSAGVRYSCFRGANPGEWSRELCP